MLIALSQKLLKDIQAIPEAAHYRQNVEKIYRHRLVVCKSHADVAAIEAAIGQGQIEELIRMAKDEEGLIPKMAGTYTIFVGDVVPFDFRPRPALFILRLRA